MKKPTIPFKVEKARPDDTVKWVQPSQKHGVTDIARSVPLPKARQPKRR